ncbi:hypothetical protein FIBSPDRAFT_860144 [Athelia psychrophila]|uniref:Uncharacterized protein n=1 Tax=Athelia psychrophila TaxID=1759441 RepID=A0A166KJP4_9AGAM|nr:hypothetical protein FIBSPDRAFT_860144 [Fibularhizoctonia sp. CBS 109695]
MLLEGGADINIQSGVPAMTALQAATATGRYQTQRLLIQWQGMLGLERQQRVLAW